MRVKALSLIESLLSSRRECLGKRSLTFMSINSCWPYEISRERERWLAIGICLACTVERLFLSIQLTFVSVYPVCSQWWESNRFIRNLGLFFPSADFRVVHRFLSIVWPLFHFVRSRAFHGQFDWCAEASISMEWTAERLQLSDTLKDRAEQSARWSQQKRKIVTWVACRCSVQNDTGISRERSCG